MSRAASRLAMQLNYTEALGYLAALAVLTTFTLSEMLPLRLMAICSNVLFAGYALLASLEPVLVLHLVLLPINAFRLLQAVQRRAKRAQLRRHTGCHGRGERPSHVWKLHRRPVAARRHQRRSLRS